MEKVRNSAPAFYIYFKTKKKDLNRLELIATFDVSSVPKGREVRKEEFHNMQNWFRWLPMFTKSCQKNFIRGYKNRNKKFQRFMSRPGNCVTRADITILVAKLVHILLGTLVLNLQRFCRIHKYNTDP